MRTVARCSGTETEIGDGMGCGWVGCNLLLGLSVCLLSCWVAVLPLLCFPLFPAIASALVPSSTLVVVAALWSFSFRGRIAPAITT